MADTWHIDYSAKQLVGATVLNTVVGPQGEKATGAIRYIDDITNPNLVRTKHVTKVEYDDFVRSGVRVDAMYMEVGLDDALGGFARGQEYARRAKAGADYLGFQGPILFCCDRWFNAPGRTLITAKQWQDYLNGARSVLGDRAGGYGFSDAADAALGVVKHFVQCGSRSLVRSWVNGWQDNTYKPVVGGIQTDRVLILRPFTSASGGEVDLNTPITTWGGVQTNLGNLLRDIQGRGQDVREAHFGDPARGSGNGFDGFGVYLFTDDPGTPQERKIRVRDFYAELRDGNKASQAKLDAVVAAFNALGGQLSQVFTAIDADLEVIKTAVGADATVQASVERISAAAEPLRELCASVAEVPETDPEPAVEVDSVPEDAHTAEAPE